MPRIEPVPTAPAPPTWNTVAHAADVLWTYSSLELYELLVVRRGMPLKTYARFVAEAMIAALL